MPSIRVFARTRTLPKVLPSRHPAAGSEVLGAVVRSDEALLRDEATAGGGLFPGLSALLSPASGYSLPPPVPEGIPLPFVSFAIGLP